MPADAMTADFETFYLRHYEMVYRICMMYTANFETMDFTVTFQYGPLPETEDAMEAFIGELIVYRK